MTRTRRAGLSALSMVLLLAAGCGSGQSSTTPPSSNAAPTCAPNDAAGQALVADAKKEGALNFYTSLQQGTAQRIADTFKQVCGIETTFYKAQTGPLVQRFSAELTAGTVPTDVLIANDLRFIGQAVSNGWLVSYDMLKSSVPSMTTGDFPRKFIPDAGPSPILQWTPYTITYNTDLVKTPPKEYTDLLDPAYKGQILISDPRNSAGYLGLWDLIYQKYGEDFFTKLRAQNFKVVPGAAEGTAAVGAGEALVHMPSAASVVTSSTTKAPVDYVVPGVNTGVPTPVGILAKAAHPNAAKLFVNWLMMRYGNDVLTADKGSVSNFPGSANSLPETFTAPRAEANDEQAMILQLLGIK